MEALGVVDPGLLEQGDGGLVGDELGDGLLAHALGDGDEGLHHELVGGASRQAADEVAVDLDVVEGQVLEVVEGAEARAEVVEGEAAAQAAQPVGEALGVLQVRDRGRLGELEDERRRIDPGLRQQPLGEGRQVPVADRLAGEVDLEQELRAGGRVLGDQPDGLPHHPAVDGLDHVEALGDVEEGARHQELAGGVVPQAHQELVLGDPARAQVEDRLRVQHQAVLGEPLAQALGLVEPRRAAAVVRAGAVDRHAVAPGFLGLVHRLVGVGQQLGVAQVAEQGDADAGRHADGLLPERRHVLPHGLDQRLGDHGGLLQIGLGQEERELVAAQPRQHIGPAGAMAQLAGDGLEQVVARLVAEAVVDLLEVIEVHHQHRAAGSVARRALDLLHELLVEAAAVEQARQQVVVHQVVEPGAERLPLRDVLDLEDHVQRGPPGVVHERGRHQHPDLPLAGVEALLDLVARDRAGHELALLRAVDVHVVLVRDRIERGDQEHVHVQAGDLAQRLVDLEPAPLQVEEAHPDRGVLERALEPLAQRPRVPAAQPDGRGAASR